jgi:hypothetical protein
MLAAETSYEGNMNKASIVLVLLAFGLSAGGGTFGCYNPETPAGHEGYVTRGAIVGQRAFVGAQTGPTSTGLGWLLEVHNVDFRWRTYNEQFKVMSADNLSLAFNAHLVVRPTPASVKEVVETYGGEEWYPRSVQEPFRNAIYEAVAGYKALEAKDKRETISADVTEKFKMFLTNKPFEIEKIVIGTIDLPEEVARSQELKISKETEIERQEFEVKIAEKKKQIKIIEAEGIAEAQRIINTTLTPLYLQHEAIQAQVGLAGSPNHSTIYIPVGTNGIPLVKTIE